MNDIPSRKGLAALAAEAGALVPCVTLGFARAANRDDVSVIYAYPQGVGEYVVPAADVPPGLAPTAPDVRDDVFPEPAELVKPVDWHLRFGGVRRIVSAPAGVQGRSARFWIGYAGAYPLGHGTRDAVDGLARRASRLFDQPRSPDSELTRLRRLERAADLLPALLHVHDIRDVLERLSTIAKATLPHDLLLLRLFTPDLSHITVFARSDGGASQLPTIASQYPPEVMRAWSFDIVDDLRAHPIEAANPPTTLGARSALRLPIRLDGQVIGGLGILSFEPAKYDGDDVAVGHRLAEHVAVGLSHSRMAADIRRASALQERAANLEMLDGLLATLAGVLDIREVFDRVSAIADRVLPHDALSIAEIIDDGTRARIHASHGLGDLPRPYDIAVPDPTMVTEAWDHRLIEDASREAAFARSPGALAGMRSVLFVAIRLEGRLFGALVFYSRTPGRYTKDDVLVARRIADHVALALSHRRLAEEARRSEELRARATSLELLDELLTTLIDSSSLTDAFARVLTIARKVIPHDAAALMVRQPDGVHAKVYASTGVPADHPQTTRVPDDLLANPGWEYHIFDDLTAVPGPNYERMAGMGFRSLLRVVIRLEGRFAGALLFTSRTVATFKPADVPVASRLADRMAVALARERASAESRRADEATERASRLEARVRALTEELDSRTGYRKVVGGSPQWRAVLTQAAQVAATETTVLLLGESGTGKEVVARFLHRGSPRANGPFVALNCAALPEQLLEAELFGYERGAYTGAVQSKPGQLEQASGGTLFLDEVAEMSPSAQAKFLRVLQEREFQRLGGTRVLRTDARIVAATNRDLLRGIATGQFREDLYYRLNVFAIRLPPLRDRRDDILPLSEAFLAEIARGLGRPPAGVSRDARHRLIEYDWPGNVRELRNVLERAAILSDGGLITADHLALDVTRARRPVAEPRVMAVGGVSPAAAPESAGDLHTIERAMIEQALQKARFNKSRAARALGMTRHQLYIRMRRHGLE